MSQRHYEALKTELECIALLDMLKEYDDRNWSVIRAVYLARLAGYQAGFRFDPDEPEWPVAFIELPTGQVSWHIAQHCGGEQAVRGMVDLPAPKSLFMAEVAL